MTMLFRRAVPALLAAVGVGCVGAGAQSVPPAAAPPRVYVTNQDDATVSILDATSHSLIGTLDLQPLGFAPTAKPHHAQVEPDGSHWYLTLISAGRVLKLDRENRIVGSVQMEVPGLLTLDATSDLLVVARSMSAVNPPQRIALIRRSDMKLLEEYDIFFPRPHALVMDPRGGHVYVASLGVNQVAGVRLEDGQLTLVDVEGPPQTFTQFAVSPDARWLVATASTARQVTVFDISEPGKPRFTRHVATEAGPFEPVFTWDGRKLYVTNLEANAVSVIDPATWQVMKVIRDSSFGQPHGVGLSPDGRYLFVSNRHQAGGAHDHEGQKATGGGVVSVICIATDEVIDRIPVGHYAAGIGVPVPAVKPSFAPPCQ